MRALKTCLLVSDDPDDHQLLFEAMKEISKDIIVTILLEGNHLIQILEQKKIQPDFVVVDTSVDNIGNDFLTKLDKEGQLKNIPVIIYTDDIDEMVNHPADKVLNKMWTYPELRSRLKTLSPLQTTPDHLL